MTVSLVQWRAVIGTFDCGSLFTVNSHSISLTGSFICFLLICILPKSVYISLLTLLYIFSFLLCNGDIEPHPGLQRQPPYHRLIWDYKKADTPNIRKPLT